MDYGTGLGLLRVKQLQTRLFEAFLQSSGVDAFNGPQGWILCALWYEDDIPIVELSRRTGLAKSTLTAMLGRMEDAGLIRRLADEKDRRVVRVHLTESSESLRAHCEAMARQLEEATFAGFSREERETFSAMLSRMASNLEATEAAHKKTRLKKAAK